MNIDEVLEALKQNAIDIALAWEAKDWAARWLKEAMLETDSKNQVLENLEHHRSELLDLLADASRDFIK